jgi:hypothetical protein
MGQRSQIYVRFNDENKKGLIANYYQWNYGERMISRARWGIESIKETLKYEWYYHEKSNVIKLSRIFDTNFDMKDVQISCNIIAEHKEEFSEDDFNEYVFKMQDNNDGKLLVDIDGETIKYAFLDSDANSDNIMDGEAYMIWDDDKNWRESKYITKEGIKACEDNIKFISENARLMTKEEVEEFINYYYMEEALLF